MTPDIQTKQAIIATLCEHPDAEKIRAKARISDAAAALEKVGTLSKADFMSLGENGKLFLDTAGAWRNFEKIAKALQAKGETFSHDDLTKPVPGYNCVLLDSARTHHGLDKLFGFDMWQGRFEEMERVWYKLPVPNRREFMNGGLVPLDLKRQLLAVEGRPLPEDRLASAGLIQSDIAAAMKSNQSFEELVAKLEKAGDHLRKEYLLLRDSAGSTVFEKSATWDRYDAITKILTENGERFDAADFTRQVSYSKSILGRAAEHRALHKVFKPAHWQNRLTDMFDLWTHVLPGWKTGSMTVHDFDAAYAEAESLTYGSKFLSTKVTRESLLAPLPDTNVLPLGLKMVWEKYDAVFAALKAAGSTEPTISDLRRVSGDTRQSCMMAAVKCGQFSKVADISKRGGGEIAIDDFLATDHHGNSMLNVLAEKGQLAQAFAPALWVDRVEDMKTLWLKVKAEHRPQVDIVKAETGARQESLKKKQGGGFKLKPKKN